MNLRRPARAAGLALAAACLAAAAAGFGLLGDRRQPAENAQTRPRLLLLTSLPLVFAEEFALDSGGSEALSALERHFDVGPIDVADRRSLKGERLLLMAHPRAQPAEALVELDAWVRSGGRLMLLADPALEWPSERPLGDPLRPPPAFADTGLLAHWGLRLDLPDQNGPQMRRLAGQAIMTASPGSLSGRCPVSADRLVARCAIGKGRAVIIADADFLDLATLDGPMDRNLAALVEELRALESSPAAPTR